MFAAYDRVIDDEIGRVRPSVCLLPGSCPVPCGFWFLFSPLINLSLFTKDFRGEERAATLVLVT